MKSPGRAAPTIIWREEMWTLVFRPWLQELTSVQQRLSLLRGKIGFIQFESTAFMFKKILGDHVWLARGNYYRFVFAGARSRLVWEQSVCSLGLQSHSSFHTAKESQQEQCGKTCTTRASLQTRGHQTQSAHLSVQKMSESMSGRCQIFTYIGGSTPQYATQGMWCVFKNLLN